jgi:predicted transcriptional regulator
MKQRKEVNLGRSNFWTRIMLLLHDNPQEQWFVLKIISNFERPISVMHTYNIIYTLKGKGLIESKKLGRNAIVSLTEKGKKVAVHIANIRNIMNQYPQKEN